MASVAPAQPFVLSRAPQQSPAHHGQKTIKELALTQLAVGLLTLTLGLATVTREEYGTCFTNAGAGVWAGLWISLTGALGTLYTTRYYRSTRMNVGYMIFSIMSTMISTVAAIFFGMSVVMYAVYGNECGLRYETESEAYDPSGHDTNRVIGLGLNIPLLLLMSVEFLASIIASVFCCRNGSYSGNEPTPAPAHSFQQQPQVIMIAMPDNPIFYSNLAVPSVNLSNGCSLQNMTGSSGTPGNFTRQMEQLNIDYTEKPPAYSEN